MTQHNSPPRKPYQAPEHEERGYKFPERPPAQPKEPPQQPPQPSPQPKKEDRG